MIKQASFIEFYWHWMPRLTKYLSGQTSDRRWVDDIAQDAMLAAREHWDELLTYDRPDAWLFKVATTMLRRWQAKTREQCTSLDDVVIFGAGAAVAFEDQVAQHLDLMAALRSLPRRQREAITLHSLLGFPLTDVADIMGISESSAKTHVCRARKALRKQLVEPSAKVSNDA